MLMGKDGIEVVEIDLFKCLRISEKRVPQFALRPIRQMPGRQRALYGLPEGMGNEVPVCRSNAEIPERHSILEIPGQDFVCSFAGKDHFHLLPGKTSNMSKSHAGWPDDRFVFMPDHLRQSLEEHFGSENNLVVLSTHVPGDLASVLKLAVLVFAISYGERLNRLVAKAGHNCRDGTRVKATAQKHSQGNVAPEVGPHRLCEEL